jgi:hypothetical protein
MRPITTGPIIALLLLACPGCSVDEPLPPVVEQWLGGIVGGEETEHWPAVGAYYTGNGMCTATLVAPDVLLTAAHCVDDPDSANDMFIMHHDVNQAGWGDTRGIEEAIQHPSYDGSAHHPHDVAVLLLYDPLEGVDFIPINRTSVSPSWEGRMMHFVGYGSNSYYGGPGSGIKRETDAEIFTYASHEVYTYTEGTNTCSGDSGGPAFMDFDGRWYVAGVISAGFALEQGQDSCEGGGVQMRTDAETSFLDDYFDVYAEPDEWYQVPDPEGDDDDTTEGDDDDTAIDFDSIPPPHVDEDEYEAIRGRECAAHAGGAAAPATAALLIGLALIALRRRA